MEGTAEIGSVGKGHSDKDSLVASFVSELAPDSPVAPVTAPEDLAMLAAGLPPGAVGWAVALGHRCSDVTRVSQGEHATELTEDDTRHAIEGSMLSLLRRLSGDAAVPVLNERQLILACIMARLDWPYERYVLALLTADQERASWFISEEFGKLAEQGPTLDDLRETALCYLATSRNLMDTARQSHVHRNTVVYRVAKIERLLGRPLDERAFATQAALTPRGARFRELLRVTPGAARISRWCLMPGAAAAPGTAARVQQAPWLAGPGRPRASAGSPKNRAGEARHASLSPAHPRPLKGFGLSCVVVQPGCAFVQRLACAKHLTIRSMVITSPQGTNPSAIDMLEFRRALGHFATGVTVVTYQPEGIDEYRGTTVNSFTSVSLDPPLILVSLGRQTRSAAALRVGSQFAVNVLHHGQRDLAMHFAGRPQPDMDVEWEVRAGVPHLAGCGAHFRCLAQDVHGAGDHVLVIGLVEEFQSAGHPPLLFYRGSFEHLRTPVVPQPAAEIFTDFPELW